MARGSRISAPSASRSTSSKPKGTSTPSYAKGNKKRKARGLDAYNIAQHTHSDRVKVKRGRLGEVEDDEPKNKKRKVAEDEDEEADEEDETPQKRQKPTNDGLDEESGSDSEGGRWRVGVAEEDDDSEVDSDEAFGSGDEERFEGFSFRGSGRGRPRNRGDRGMRRKEEDGDDEEEESDFGDEGVDLAAMLDDDGGSEEEAAVPKRVQKDKYRGDVLSDLKGDADDESMETEDDEDDAPSEYDEEDEEDGKFEMSEDEESGDEDRTKHSRLQDLVDSTAPVAADDSTDGAPPDRKALLARALASLQTSSSIDPSLSREAQRLSRNLQPSAKDSKKSTLVSAPLPKRQQDRIDRVAARQETNKTLDRWIDTVKHNRRADNLTFPLVDPTMQEPRNTTVLTSTAASAPQTDLERTIASIMKESGLGQSGGKAAERELENFEELAANKMSLEEVEARRAELRKQRDLLFREEIKARRIKKIKSKAYRRVHSKEAQKQAGKERDLLVAAGIEGSDDEREANDRRRAEERMGARHRESKWAKSVKATGRGVWDDGARDGVTEMARRGEELRRRQEGRREEDEVGSDVDSSSDDDDGGFGLRDDDDEASRLQRQLGRVDTDVGNAGESKLGNLMFMQRADAARKKRNVAEANQLRKDLAGNDSDGESGEEEQPETSIGRKVFGPTESRALPAKTVKPRAEFEEGASDSEAEGEYLPTPEDDVMAADSAPGLATTKPQPHNKALHASSKLAQTGRAKVFEGHKASSKQVDRDVPQDKAKSNGVSHAADKAPNTNGWTIVNMPAAAQRHEPKATKTTSEAIGDINGADEGSDAELNEEPLASSNWDLVQAAFGDGEVEKEFEAEKASAASSEDEKFEDNTLPGWGSWAGEGISKKALKREAQKKKGRFMVKTAAGIKPSDRKDAKLDRVIISEKRQKKNAKYLANVLPHPFESKTQYERGLGQPIGPEWTTKVTFQDATKPRVLTKPGRAIKPIEAPLL